MDKPAHHKVPIVRIKEVLPHPNAERLDIIPVEGYQAISAKGQFKVGDLAYYIYPDSIVPVRPEFEFLWKDKIVQEDGTWRDGLKEVPQKYRRIRAVRLRKEWSEGLLMPVNESTGFDWTCTDCNGVDMPLYNWTLNGKIVGDGDDLSDLLEITHYQPPDPEDLKGQNERGPGRHLPRSFKGWMYYFWWKTLNLFGFDTPLQGTNEKGPKHGKPYYDIENFKNHASVFEPGEPVVATEKLHGCQGKYVFQDGKMYVGSRNFWKSPKSKCVWRKCLEQNKWVEDWCRAHEGYTLYGEVIPVQGEKFMYGYKQGEVGFRVFDILKPNGEDMRDQWMSWIELTEARPILPPNNWVPQVYQAPFDIAKLKALAEEKSALGGGIREGLVIKPIKERHARGLGRVQLKLISNQYLEKS